jgi:hypothetical protein
MAGAMVVAVAVAMVVVASSRFIGKTVAALLTPAFPNFGNSRGG